MRGDRAESVRVDPCDGGNGTAAASTECSQKVLPARLQRCFGRKALLRTVDMGDAADRLIVGAVNLGAVQGGLIQVAGLRSGMIEEVHAGIPQVE